MFGVNKELAVHGSSRVGGTCSVNVQAAVVVHIHEVGRTHRRSYWNLVNVRDPPWRSEGVLGVMVLGSSDLPVSVLATVVVQGRRGR